MTSFWGFMFHQLTFRPKPLSPDVRLDGKTAIVTGSNVGLGFEAASELAAHGLSRLVLAVRSEPKGEEAKSKIAAASPACDIRVWPLDQEDVASVVAFAERARAQLDRLDIACLNAGLKRLEFSQSPKTRHEAHVQINHLGTALPSLLLLEPLRRTARETGAPSRMSITASSVAFFIAPTETLTAVPEGHDGSLLKWLDDPASFGTAGSDKRYSLSKLLNVLWMRALAAHVDGKEVVINTFNPGYCRSEFHRVDPSAERISHWIAWSTEQGAWHITDAAVRHPGSHGKYLSEQRIRP